jgi:hypothetical protein
LLREGRRDADATDPDQQAGGKRVSGLIFGMLGHVTSVVAVVDAAALEIQLARVA